MGRDLIILFSALLLVSCQEVFVPDVEEVEPFLMVEGSITTRPGTHTVSIHYSSTFKNNPTFKQVNTAHVYVEDDLANKTYFYSRGNGAYQTDTAQIFAAEVGRTYTLIIETEDGNIFRSEPQTVVACPDIQSLYCSLSNESILTENVYGEAYEIPYDGISVITGTNGILPYNNYYLYRYVAYEEHKTVIQIGVSDYYLYGHRKLSGKYSNYLRIGNADEFGNFALRNKKILFIARDDMTTYDPPLPDTITILSTTFEGLLFELEQLSLTPDAYTFWKDAVDQLEATGRLFDPVAPQLHGNIHCVSDSVTRIIGIFYASDISEKVAYLYISSKNRTFSKDLGRMPDLYLDSLEWTKPDDWVDRPF
jgi:hypothetical protein